MIDYILSRKMLGVVFMIPTTLKLVFARQPLLWLAVCKRYSFIHDFAVEVLRVKFLCLGIMLTHDDYDFFYNKKAQWNEKLETLSPTTRNKN